MLLKQTIRARWEDFKLGMKAAPIIVLLVLGWLYIVGYNKARRLYREIHQAWEEWRAGE